MPVDLRNEYYRYRRYFVNIGKITHKTQLKSLAWISLSLLTVTFFAITAIQPTLLTIAKLNREITDKKEAGRKLQTKINTIIAAQNEFAKNVDNLPLLAEALPEKNNFPTLAIFFEDAASASGVEIKSVSFEDINLNQSPTKKDTKANTFKFSVRALGNYTDLRTFLKTIESSRRIVKIEGLSYSLSKIKDLTQLAIIIQGTAAFELPAKK